jgi:ribosomal protein S18 acetylase RimI-like enzyme
MRRWTVEIPCPRGLLRLRPEREDDMGFRFRLFRDSRPDLALLPLDAAARGQLIALQFQAQTMSYRTQFPGARFDIIELGDVPVGRIVVDRPGTMLHIVDQTLSPPFRNLGLGSTIMRALMGEAERSGLPVRLRVASDNAAAMRLYLRLGFVPIEASPVYVHLERRAQPDAR